ncbi:threonine 3-dehydrogenase [Micromonospora pallida]|uniref:Threonine 3-dehydrogenase n=1 Tax=Micromonospora pallida TaxID=145854 RepID=A0A1C6RXK9_9ACTN|nr:alcohol dehydrogenase catalytic domain-containing protein [Micromonospora pallida]SCL21770.1 threonine 3-dehydrogenase [Micromonospora pallida]
MEAVIKTGPYPGIEVADVPEPTPGPGEVLIEVEAASVCGTDYTLADWTAGAAAWGPSFPLTMGHEYCGRVVAVGEGVQAVTVGQRIAGESHVWCGTCEACRRDARHNCLNISIPGVSRNGAFAPLLAVPETACFPLADEIGPEAVLFESAGVAMHAIQQAGDVAGRSIAITGAGPVGLFLIAELRALGAGEVLVLEPNPARRERAAALGATTFTGEQAAELAEHARRIGPLGGVEIGFEVSGAPAAYEAMFGTLGLEGTLVSVGHSSTPVGVHITRDVNLRVINWKGVYGRRIWSSWERLQELVLSGRVDLAPFIEGELKVAELPERMADIRQLPGKVVVRP